MALVSITVWVNQRSTPMTAHVLAHGVHDGSYGDLWERTLELPPGCTDARAVLLGLAGAIHDVLGSGDGDGLSV